jgi:hypothetical protein
MLLAVILCADKSVVVGIYCGLVSIKVFYFCKENVRNVERITEVYIKGDNSEN